MAISEHNDKTMKQMSTTQTRKVLNKPKSDPVERKLQEDNKPSTSDAPSRPKSWPNKIEVNFYIFNMLYYFLNTNKNFVGKI